MTAPAREQARRLGESRVARRSVSEGVADYIRERVFFGDLRDGDRVPQRSIAEDLGVSSVPVREALAALQREGVVTIEPNRGAFVNGLDADVIREQFYVFGRIYGLAARNTAKRRDAGLAAKLIALAERVRDETDLDLVLSLSIEFQLLVFDHGGSKRLRALASPIWGIVPGNFFETIPGSADLARRDLPEIAAQIEARRASGAERACWRLIDEIAELVALRFDA